jgi:hypothetical protein
VSGQEVNFVVTLLDPFQLPAGQYFFVPQVQVAGPTSNFYWLSAPRPIAAPGTPFPAGATDLQAWIRNSALDPDWLRVGTDIVGGAPPPTFNAAFTLSNFGLPFTLNIQALLAAIGVRLTVQAPAAGTVQASDPLVGHGHRRAWFNTVTTTASKAGAVRLKVVPNAVGRKQLAGGRTRHLPVRVTFTPTGGQPTSHQVSITWHGK